MKTLLLLALTMAFGPLQIHGGLVSFQNMIWFKTRKFALYHYNFYGCYCGSGGQGYPLDATDRCCAEHDCCYERLEKQKCGTMLLVYHYHYENGKIVCEDQDDCRRQLCECDKAATYCFARNLNTYNKQYQFYKDKNCLGSDYLCFPPPEASPPTLSFPLWSPPLPILARSWQRRKHPSPIPETSQEPLDPQREAFLPE